MARRKEPTWDDIALLQGTTRFELFRRMRGYAQAHLDHRLDEGASESEVAWLRRDVAEFTRILDLDFMYPLDTPEREPEGPVVEQPLAPEGMEEWMIDFIDWLLEGEPA